MPKQASDESIVSGDALQIPRSLTAIYESLRNLCQAKPAEDIEHILHLLDDRDLPPPAFYHTAFHLLLAESYYSLDRVNLSMGMLELARGIRASVRPIDIEDGTAEAWQSLQARIDELHAEELCDFWANLLQAQRGARTPTSRVREKLGATDSGIVLEPLVLSEDPHRSEFSVE
ncbi:hypothetical protein QFC24_004104 [Naganishia onofrii]|uniref:Uncharacterized protein n=1 Tax=Naganishia onofrii TaxID=1851511 RepID=A0ACC2XGD2_9TREE|nr:hypothetical protein QFC24_004104 [Naganishia onofrii]